LAVGFGTFLGEGGVGGEGAACAGVGPDRGEVFGPVACGVGGGVGGEDGAVELFVGEFEPGGALVVEVGEGAFFAAGVFGGGGLDGGLGDEDLRVLPGSDRDEPDGSWSTGELRQFPLDFLRLGLVLLILDVAQFRDQRVS